MKYGEEEIRKSKLERWENPSPERKYKIFIQSKEFTCLCPRSGYPDFATIKVTYIPKKYIVELKSFKLFLNKFRNEYISHEKAANTIYDELKKLLKPEYIEVRAEFNPRGNVETVITISSDDEKKGRSKR
ncbi:MAG: NADPH-dependent 7-cyano-7-deazaguanine reductase QueF [Candidatus Schekmanbacteria bacterium]|nr:MAG: NADPH-dependent 7-cyano-7-deazaguanine reductase QueF [Candidatus Schekmanbacteria bacterium]